MREQVIYSSKKRNVSIDALRVLAMLFIVIWHSTNHGGLDALSYGLTPFNSIVHLIQAFTCVSVNVYVLISGYFLCTQVFRPSRLLKIIVQVLFYSWVLFIICYKINPSLFSAKDYLHFALPISYRLNWFVTTYIGLYLLSPALNFLIKNLGQKRHLAFLVLLILSTSVWHDLLPSSFGLDVYDGKRLSWFIVLYFIAAYIRLYVNAEKLKTRRYFAIYILSCISIWIIWAMTQFAIQRGAPAEASNYMGKYFYMYSSSFVLLSSICLFIGFLGLNWKGRKLMNKTIFAIAPLTLGVYLIHDNYIFREFIWGVMKSMASINVGSLLICLLYCIGVFVTCIIIDSMRNKLFGILYKTNFWESISDWVDTLPQRTYSVIEKLILS